MTTPRHTLHPSSTTQLAAVALAAQGEYGVVTDLAREHSIRRQRVYDIRERGRAALVAEFTPAVPGLVKSFELQVTAADIKRTVVGLRAVAPTSIRDIEAALPIIYGVHWSYGKIIGVLHEAEQKAAAFLEEVDLSNIKSIALDEMFSQGQPVFAGICLDSQYLFQTDVQRDRSGATWAECLGELRDRQGLQPKRVVKDAGTGLGAGVRECWPGADENDDLFHAVYMMGKEAYHLERAAYRAIGKVDKLVVQVARGKADEEALAQAWAWMDAAIERYDGFEALRREAGRVLELTDRGSGILRTSSEVVTVLTRVSDEMKAIGGKRIKKVAKYIGNRAQGLGRYLDDLAARLKAVTAEAGGIEVTEAAIRAYQASLEVSRRGPAWDRKARKQALTDAAHHLLNTTEHDRERLMKAIGTIMPVLANRYRASSAIENLNSVLRPYLVVQKHAEQGFLNLFRFYWNTRKRQWGRWKGTSPVETLTGTKVEDWLTLLGFPPGEAFAVAA